MREAQASGADKCSFLFANPRWEADTLSQLQANVVSMPAGEGVGVVAFALALKQRLPRLRYVIIFTDSKPIALNDAPVSAFLMPMR